MNVLIFNEIFGQFFLGILLWLRTKNRYENQDKFFFLQKSDSIFDPEKNKNNFFSHIILHLKLTFNAPKMSIVLIVRFYLTIIIDYFGQKVVLRIYRLNVSSLFCVCISFSIFYTFQFIELTWTWQKNERKCTA